jgi:hypothetical protein
MSGAGYNGRRVASMWEDRNSKIGPPGCAESVTALHKPEGGVKPPLQGRNGGVVVGDGAKDEAAL